MQALPRGHKPYNKGYGDLIQVEVVMYVLLYTNIGDLLLLAFGTI